MPVRLVVSADLMTLIGGCSFGGLLGAGLAGDLARAFFAGTALVLMGLLHLAN